MAINNFFFFFWEEYPSNWSITLKQNYQDIQDQISRALEYTTVENISVKSVILSNPTNSYSQAHSQSIVNAINVISENQKLIAAKINEVINGSEEAQ